MRKGRAARASKWARTMARRLRAARKWADRSGPMRGGGSGADISIRDLFSNISALQFVRCCGALSCRGRVRGNYRAALYQSSAFRLWTDKTSRRAMAQSGVATRTLMTQRDSNTKSVARRSSRAPQRIASSIIGLPCAAQPQHASIYKSSTSAAHRVPRCSGGYLLGEGSSRTGCLRS